VQARASQRRVERHLKIEEAGRQNPLSLISRVQLLVGGPDSIENLTRELAHVLLAPASRFNSEALLPIGLGDHDVLCNSEVHRAQVAMLSRHSGCIENLFAAELRRKCFALSKKGAPKSAGGPNFQQTVGACVNMAITEII
jgi:hypothetical protein